MIRISSQQIFSGGISRMQDVNSNLVKTQEQISTGKKVNRPSDDPVAAARILKLNQEVKRIETYERNANLADNRIKQEESTLSSAVDIIQRVRELTVQAGSGSLSANDRQSISAELKERLGQLANIANTRDASGEYIFSGFQGSTPAFAKDDFGAWKYQGDEGQRVLEIDDGVTVPISDHGKGIFVNVPAAVSVVGTGDGTGQSANGFISGLELVAPKDLKDAFSAATPNVPNDFTISVGAGGGLSITAVDADGNPTAVDAAGDPLDLTPTPAPVVGEEFVVAGIRLTVNDGADGDEFTLGISDKQSIFGTIEKLIAGLDSIDKATPKSSAEYDALIAESLTNLDNGQESIILKQTELGGRLNAIESTSSFLEDSGLYTKEIRSQLQDVDYAEAISNLSFQSFVLQAAQQSFAQISRLSLFDRL
ncbi:MAG: flagellar hook-associated protein FlgL [Marinobacter sp.]|uniref:flagellar hook-associated protein FlgL n=1 Tax=Marinobacter sp. TaxID=50741 RepID=UPI0029C20F33|nr:flagellar hook-associated protein FlgL [Marinobacter sp.]MDX5440218.1 flagellar hook-associated protein FlgL [Alteromonadaceae bacterium]MDX5327998.1 flagellar hook-associated protein FlgL [Marinobacter sp.]MDX5337050.1 flagellar hook-associated protein FlgL [Marinobacter sp.]MDX5388285.1 flagellar hook-associated protein FlgL [Marinobacter sp.]MDX5473524.1 flagellar hook-associated protein FlgL [Marinobacter sp.]